jgi:hypothetical protein
MNTQAETTIASSTQLCRIYKTDPFGFPLYTSDEEQYNQSKQEQGINPDAISQTHRTDSDDGEQSNIYESVLNM